MTSMIPSLKDFELYQCKQTLLKLMKKKADYLQQNMSPNIFIFGKTLQDKDTVSLRCYVSHKYLEGVRVQLTLDRMVLKENVNVSGPAPNMDGSLQIRLQTETSIKEPDRYHCAVDTNNLHISTGWNGLTLDQMQSEKNGSHEIKLYIYIIPAILLIIMLVIEIYICKRVQSLRNINREERNEREVQHCLRHVQSDEEFRREAEVDDEFYQPRHPRNIQENPRPEETI
ncbi:uncharacterized protein [Hoplias malabaricus]|uniref:uncharacterized protein n=1 Tax=Hoplias malabaricus TaxID=27720 RepID=UPI0034629E10